MITKAVKRVSDSTPQRFNVSLTQCYSDSHTKKATPTSEGYSLLTYMQDMRAFTHSPQRSRYRDISGVLERRILVGNLAISVPLYISVMLSDFECLLNRKFVGKSSGCGGEV